MDSLPRNIVQAISTSIQTLSEQPLQELLPFQSDIRSVEQQLSGLVHAIIGCQTDQESSATVATISNSVNGTRDNATLTHEAEEDIYTGASSFFEVQELLHAASKQLDSIQPNLTDLSDLSFNWLSQDERLLHIQPIFAVLQSTRSRESTLPEKIMLLCACMSLANDFRVFEIDLQGYAKQDVLATDVLTGSTPFPQKLGKNFRHFYASLHTPLDYRKLDAGVRLGTKLNIAMLIGERVGIGSCLALILGLETKRFSRLSYQSFAWIELELRLEQHGPMYLSIQAFAAIFSRWWHVCQNEYRQRYEQTTGVQRNRAGEIAGLSFPLAFTQSSPFQTVEQSSFSEMNLELEPAFAQTCSSE